MAVEGLEVVRAVEPGRAVESRAVLGQLLRDVRVLRRALEQHVLEQVRHAGFAVALVARAHHVRHVDRDRWLDWSGNSRTRRPLRGVLGDALDRRDLHRRRRRAGGRRCALGGRSGRSLRGRPRRRRCLRPQRRAEQCGKQENGGECTLLTCKFLVRRLRRAAVERNV